MYSCTHWMRACKSPPPPTFGPIYEGAIGQPRLTTSLCNPDAWRRTNEIIDDTIVHIKIYETAMIITLVLTPITIHPTSSTFSSKIYCRCEAAHKVLISDPKPWKTFKQSRRVFALASIHAHPPPPSPTVQLCSL